MNKYLKVFIFMICAALPLYAQDFGLILDQTVGYGGYENDGDFDYQGILVPRLSVPVGEGGEIFVSAGVRADYQNETSAFVPELLRTEFILNFGDGEFRVGRMQYSDPLGFIAEGLFDGARFSWDTAMGIFSVGGWYTGLLYKKRANIAMTVEELQSGYEEVDYDDFADTYFAPRRFVWAAGWEHPALKELIRVKTAALGQVDLSGGDLHSEYVAVKLIVPVGAFVFDLGGALEAIHNSGETDIALTGELKASWKTPIPLDDQLSLTGRFSSGVIEDSPMIAFLPLSTVTQGNILKAKISGLSVISLDYLARLHRTFAAGLEASCFIRSDLGTYNNPFFGETKDGYIVGSELFGRLLWSPVSDLQFNVGGGVFLPAIGNVAPEAGALWRIECNIILLLY